MFHELDSADRNPSSAKEFNVEQAGAICLRRKRRELQVLVSSRRTGRWGLPKGHLEASETSRQAAEREAFEEAGVRGIVDEVPFGSFLYSKGTPGRTCRVTAHVLRTKSESTSFPERQIRTLKWVAVEGQPVRPGIRDYGNCCPVSVPIRPFNTSLFVFCRSSDSPAHAHNHVPFPTRSAL
ncbi:NUDIX domain-containing protein [Pararhizobium sp. BT-229]|uniref:NUDIX hydrolase n=1 Tax=Pararhizobium sp. BT-229 TaxID=2986923 RepID=UPI0021F7152C|nr:NUDIX domain-containing protein [Pararhizobium sp. BT-229]MCV9966753.1 NUDIX domain-containing protein [Pararhizobium sp. BT-229]